MLLPQNGNAHWNAFMANTLDVISEYVETDLLSLYALMTNTYAINGPLTKGDLPRIRETLKHSSKSTGRGISWFPIMTKRIFLKIKTCQLGIF